MTESVYYMCVCVCVCVCICVCVCVPLTFKSSSSETQEVIIIKLGMVTASDVVMRHVLSMLTLTLFKVTQIFLNHENHTCSIISETVQAIPIKFALKIV